MKPELLAQRLATFRTEKAADARIMAECTRVAKDVVFVAADDSQAVITVEMRELISARSTGRQGGMMKPQLDRPSLTQKRAVLAPIDAANGNMRAQGRTE